MQHDPENDFADIESDTDVYSVLEEDKTSEYASESEEDVEPKGNLVERDGKINSLQNHHDIDEDRN